MPIKVLIADDSAFFRKIISDQLSQEKSIKVINQAKNGNEAIKMVKKYRPDVLLLDLLMPEIDGIEAFDIIMKEFPTTTIILSAVSPKNLDTSVQALLIGAFDYIMKPGGIEEDDLPVFREKLVDKILLASKSQIKSVFRHRKSSGRAFSLRQSLVNEVFGFGKYINKIKTSKEEKKRTITKRQSLVSETFELAKTISEIKPDLVESERKIFLRQSIVSEVFRSAVSMSESKPSSEISEENILKTIKEEIEFEEVKKLKARIEETEPIDEEPTITMPTYEEIEQSELVQKRIEEKLPEKHKEEKLKPIEKEKVKIKEIEPIIDKVEKKEVKKLKVIKKKKAKALSKEKIINRLEQIKIELANRVKPPKIEKKPPIYIPDLTPVKHVYISSKLIVIGASTGGPRTIRAILQNIPKNFSCPIMVVQHLNAHFIELFANALKDVCEIKVKVAEDGEFLESGVVYIAPGDKHMEVSVKNHQPCVKIYPGKPVNFVIPSVDVLFYSAARVYKDKIIGILLTGMGYDGVDGLGAIQLFGGKTISESKETCVLFGMPKKAAERGLADLILPNYQIKDYIVKFAM